MRKKEKETEDDGEDTEHIEMCCPAEEDESGEFAKKVRRKILLKLGDELEGRGNVVMATLSDENLKQIDALVEVERHFTADLRQQLSSFKRAFKREKTFSKK